VNQAYSPADRREEALEYHRSPRAGKLSVEATKPCATADDLALAYSPGVAEPVREIDRDPNTAYEFTNKGNLIAVISDGTAVLGLGNVGPLASKPVMEGKAVLFKQFADIDVFDIEVDAPSVESFIETVINIAPTFGGINLEDIAAPHCFQIERTLREKLSIPVFHDDQHGTAVVICAALLNALSLQNKKIETAQFVLLGAGAAGLATAYLLRGMGAQHIKLLNRKGVIHTERTDLDEYLKEWAVDTSDRSLSDAMKGADVFIGVSAANVVDGDMIQSMADNPIVFALANPDPEIRPAEAYAARSDIIMATGRSDYPNQVNNALCFPYLFRGALNARATRITDEMLIAAVNALAELAREPVPESVLTAYETDSMAFGKDYIIPKPFDPRLSDYVSNAVAAVAF
jgi:malate dehydrogenase (oxaloacetate-decarboxylating)(NADP+)